MTILLGTRVRDTVTGLEGTATGRIEYLHGSPRYMVDRVTDDNKLVSDWFDEARLEPVDE